VIEGSPNMERAMNDRERTIAFEMNYCQHYKPPRGPEGWDTTWCAAGEDHLTRRLPNDQQPQGAEFKAAPCIGGHHLTDPTAACPKWIRRTREMGEARADAKSAFLARMALVGPVVAAWRKKAPRGKAEVIECPACKGRLHLSQAAYNGHVHGRCETAGCVSWME